MKKRGRYQEAVTIYNDLIQRVRQQGDTLGEMMNTAKWGPAAYYFTPESTNPITKCGHSIELPIVFNQSAASGDAGREYDATFSKTMRKMWIQFAKTGNPSLSAAESPDGKAKEWPLYDTTEKKVMVLDEFNIHPARESEVKIVDWERTYWVTKYPML